jgi:hypothetical protein
MADQKISQLNQVSNPTGSEELAVNNSGASEKMTSQQVADLAAGSIALGDVLVNGSGNYAITGVGFEPSYVRMTATLPVDGRDVTLTGSGNEDGFSGYMVGYAVNDGTPTQQASYTGGSGNSINNIRAGSSSSHVVYVQYGDQNGNNIAQIYGTLESFDSDGFTINIGTYNSVGAVSGLLLFYEAIK